ncbi:MAG: hypothetical protein ABI655_06285, partial [Phenylobacterium sp.]
VASACFLLSAPSWATWAKRRQAAPRWACATPQRRESELEMGHGLMVLGAAAATWFLLTGPMASTGLMMFSASC